MTSLKSASERCVLLEMEDASFNLEGDAGAVGR